MAGRRWWFGALVLLGAVSQAMAAPIAREQIEASMLLSGSVDIETDGSVATYKLDKADELPKAVVDMLGTAIKAWHFEPVVVDGHAAAVRSNLSMRIVAKEADKGAYTFRIAGVSFDYGDDESPSSHGKLKPPRYPEEAARAGIGGTVYLVLKIGRDGGIEDIVAEQVNLKWVAPEAQMKRWRERLARVSLETARSWTFDPPTRGPDIDEPYWSIRVPVDFVAPSQQEAKPSLWEAYVPGPRQDVPWRSAEQAARISPDAIAGSGVHPDNGRGPRLLTPIGGS